MSLSRRHSLCPGIAARKDIFMLSKAAGTLSVACCIIILVLNASCSTHHEVRSDFALTQEVNSCDSLQAIVAQRLPKPQGPPKVLVIPTGSLELLGLSLAKAPIYEDATQELGNFLPGSRDDWGIALVIYSYGEGNFVNNKFVQGPPGPASGPNAGLELALRLLVGRPELKSLAFEVDRSFPFLNAVSGDFGNSTEMRTASLVDVSKQKVICFAKDTDAVEVLTRRLQNCALVHFGILPDYLEIESMSEQVKAYRTPKSEIASCVTRVLVGASGNDNQ